jgi:hypothetical protein
MHETDLAPSAPVSLAIHLLARAMFLVCLLSFCTTELKAQETSSEVWPQLKYLSQTEP